MSTLYKYMYTSTTYVAVMPYGETPVNIGSGHGIMLWQDQATTRTHTDISSQISINTDPGHGMSPDGTKPLPRTNGEISLQAYVNTVPDHGLSPHSAKSPPEPMLK